MKVGCSRRQSSWVLTTATIVIHQHLSVGKWFLVGILKTTASAFASTNTNLLLTTSTPPISVDPYTTGTSTGNNHHNHFRQTSPFQIPFASLHKHQQQPHSKITNRRFSSSKSALHQYSTKATELADVHEYESLSRSGTTKRISNAIATTTTTFTSTSTIPHSQQHDQSIQQLVPSKRRIDRPHQVSDPQQGPHRDTQSSSPSTKEYAISLRLANLSDIASISSCNIQTLPENYNDLFYINHITDHPFLSFVAVVDVPNDTDESSSHRHRQVVHGNYEPNNTNNNNNSNNESKLGFIHRHLQLSKRRFAATFWTPQNQYHQSHNHDHNNHVSPSFTYNENSDRKTNTGTTSVVVGYLLGKITTPQEPYQYSNRNIRNDNSNENNNNNNQYINFGGTRIMDHHMKQQRSNMRVQHEMIGHVSSLAVLPEARRRGLAQALLEQFHHHLLESNKKYTNHNQIVITSTGLHVRCSNVVAVKLYEKLGYIPAITIPSYYEDGEDAYYMQKILYDTATENNNTQEERISRTRISTENQQRHQYVRQRNDIQYYQLPRTISVISDKDVNNNNNVSGGNNNQNGVDTIDSDNTLTERMQYEDSEEDEEQILMNGTL